MFSLTARRRGVSIVYMCFAMVAVCGFVSFAVDLGRVQLAKTQLQIAADSAARAAAIEVGAGGSTAEVRVEAKAWASANPVDDGSVTLTNGDIEIGRWVSGAFTTSGSPRNAVRITANQINSRGTAIPLTFAKVLGRSTLDVKAVATAYVVSEQSTTATVDGTDNPWLAGMPNGTQANVGNPKANPDSAPAQSPYQVGGMTITPGQVLTFGSITGTVNYDPSTPLFGPDGDTAYIVQNFAGAENGIASMNAPMNAVVGVFLGASQPNLSAAPAMLDFTSAASREFTSISPALKQPFFIGDGKTSSGAFQQFVVPAGATRFYLATMDTYEWNNNSGTRTIPLKKPAKVSLVK